MVDKVTLYDIIDMIAVYNYNVDASVHLCFCANAEHNKIDRVWSELND